MEVACTGVCQVRPLTEEGLCGQGQGQIPAVTLPSFFFSLKQ